MRKTMSIMENIVYQLSQIIEAMNIRNKDELLSDTKLYPIEQIEAINSCSGDQLSDPM